MTTEGKRKWRNKYPEKAKKHSREQAAKYRKKHRDNLNQYHAEWRKNNPEKLREYSKKYQSTEKAKAYRKERYRKMKAALETVESANTAANTGSPKCCTMYGDHTIYKQNFPNHNFCHWCGAALRAGA